MSSNDSMLDIYLYENTQLLESLESQLLLCEKTESFSADSVAEIFRALHTIKGSSAMMNFDSIANLSHALEDLFGYLREHETRKEDHGKISELSFETLDMIKTEIAKIQSSGLPDGDVSGIINRIEEFLAMLTGRKAQPQPAEEALEYEFSGSGEGGNCYRAKVVFEQGCKMENIRAFGIVKSLENLCSNLATEPFDLFAEHIEDKIAAEGFVLYIMSGEPADVISAKIREAFFIDNMEFSAVDAAVCDKVFGAAKKNERSDQPEKAAETLGALKQSYMSVNLNKLDQLMDLVGEIVITEATVTKNPEVKKLRLESFDKAARQLRKLTDELQDIVMSIRMVPVSATFHKMERIMRDMAVKFDKKARLTIIGEDTELDKNVLDNLSDPLMHIVRNSMDHGLEPSSERKRLGKNPVGEITLEARNTGGDVIILISDDGRGLNKEALIKKGVEKGLIKKPESEVTDKEAYNLIFAPGFSTKEQVTEFSGRGVGMDVVLKNIEKIGGSVSVNSELGKGTAVKIRIPLTLAIIDGMQVSVGGASFIVPLLTIRESFKPGVNDVFSDPSGNEMIFIRENCYPVMRLYEVFGIETQITNPEDGILVTIESQSQTYCLMVDDLVGEHQTVVKPIPVYISKTLGDTKSIAGCTILGDGSISLILDINGLFLQKRSEL